MKSMRISSYLLAMLFSLPLFVHAQWQSIPSGTRADLMGVDFLDDHYGVIVGTQATVLVTTDGGKQWSLQPASDQKVDFRAVKILGVDTLLIGAGDYYDSQLLRSTDGGKTFTVIGKGIALGEGSSGLLTVYNQHLDISTDSGMHWETVAPIGGTTQLYQFDFPDTRTGFLMGNVSGFTSYSTYVLRSVDGGGSWLPLYTFDFPNSFAYSSGWALNADTLLVAVNEQVRFLPGPHNQLYKFYDFVYENFQGLESWRFHYTLIKDSLPAYFQAMAFTKEGTGFAVSPTGAIYRSTDSGTSWTAEYEGSAALLGLSLGEGKVAVAIGTNGTILQRSSVTSSGEAPLAIPVTVYPNPVRAEPFWVVTEAEVYPLFLRLFDGTGRLVQSWQLNEPRALSLPAISRGIYWLEGSSAKGAFRKPLVVNP